MVTGDAIWLILVGAGVTGLTVAAWMTGRFVLSFAALFGWAAFGMWVANLAPSPAGSPNLRDLTVLMVGVAALVVGVDMVRRVMAGRADPEDQARQAYRARLESLDGDGPEVKPKRPQFNGLIEFLSPADKAEKRRAFRSVTGRWPRV
ncbi:MAG: hypothetical protein Q7R40_15375 [Phaeospirillum sp.]|nr:hypothetical protein [Phaeospirillum sp.]